MKVKKLMSKDAFNSYEPCIDILIKTAEDIIPDTIDMLSISCFVDLYPLRLGRLEIRFYIHMEGKIPALYDYGIKMMKKTICFRYCIDNDTKNLDSYQKYISGNFGYELRNIIMDIIHFSKTGELLEDEEGGIKHYSFLTEG